MPAEPSTVAGELGEGLKMEAGDQRPKPVLRLREDGFVEIVEGVDEVRRLLGVEAGRRLVTLCEALLLVADGRAVLLSSDGRRLSLEEAVVEASKFNPDAWLKLEVFNDLRRRGRIVAPGPRRNTLLVKLRRRSPNYDYYVLVAEERRPIRLATLMSFIEEALKNGWTPLIAVVDAYGDVTYYMPSRFQGKPQGGRGEDSARAS